MKSQGSFGVLLEQAHTLAQVLRGEVEQGKERSKPSDEITPWYLPKGEEEHDDNCSSTLEKGLKMGRRSK